MINNLRFELTFKNISQLEKKLNFCKTNKIYNINIPCKGLIKKELFNNTYEYISKNYGEFNVTFHYSLYHQYSKNKENSYKEFLNFLKKSNSNKNFKILLVSGSNKKKNFDAINVLSNIKSEKNLKAKLGIAYNPYLKKYYNLSNERKRYEQKISSGLINSIWLQFGTDINLLEKEVSYLRKYENHANSDLFGSLLIPSKQFVSRFKFRPWRGVHISENYLSSLEDFYSFTRDLVSFYLENKITPVIETDVSASDKLDFIYSFFRD